MQADGVTAMGGLYVVCGVKQKGRETRAGFRTIRPAPLFIDNVDVSLYDNFMMKNALAEKIPATFLEYLANNPEAHVVAIVRCQALRPDYVSAAENAGLVVERELRLIRGLVVRGCAKGLLKLSEESWVLRVEPDESVHTMRLEASNESNKNTPRTQADH